MSDTEDKRLQELIKHAESGDAEAQNILAAELAAGFLQGGTDPTGALFWYCEAIKQGHVHAKWNAATMFLHGEGGIQKDEKIAMRLIEDAANCNETGACLFLVSCYEQGMHGKPIDRNIATKWYQRAWDTEAFKAFSDPIDLVADYSVVVQQPQY